MTSNVVVRPLKIESFMKINELRRVMRSSVVPGAWSKSKTLLTIYAWTVAKRISFYVIFIANPVKNPTLEKLVDTNGAEINKSKFITKCWKKFSASLTIWIMQV